MTTASAWSVALIGMQGTMVEVEAAIGAGLFALGTDAASLAGQPIAAQKGALQQTLAESQFPDSKLTLLPKVPQAVQELKAGNVVAVLVDAISAEQYVKQNPDLAVAKVEVVIDPTEAGSSAAVMKGNTDLMDYLNAEIKKYKDSGDLDQWFVDAKAQAEEMGLD